MLCITLINLHVKVSLHPKNQSHLVLLSNAYYVFLNWFSNIVLKNFFTNIHQEYWSIIFQVYSGKLAGTIWLWCQGNAGLVEWIKIPPLLQFFFFFWRVWEGLVIILLCMFDRIHEWIWLVLGFSVLGEFWLLF